MRFILFVIYSIFTITSVLQAQNIEVHKVEKDKNGLPYTEYSMKLATTDIQSIERDWIKFLRFVGRANHVEISTDRVFTALNANNNIYFINPVHIISNIGFTENGIKVYAHFMRVSDSTYIDLNINEDKNVRLKNFMREFGRQQLEIANASQIEIEKSNLKQLDKELSRVHSAKKKHNKKIKKLERNIAKQEKKLSLVIQEQALVMDNITSQKEKVAQSASFSKHEKKASRKTLRDYEKQFNKVQKKIDKLKRNISNSKEAIKDEQVHLDKHNANKEALQKRIEEQQNRVRELK